MYSPLHLARKYLYYYLTASNGKGHGIHSPFIFQFIRDILNDRTAYADYEQVEQLRLIMLQDQSLLEVNDLGAGSMFNNGKQRTVSDIAKNASKPKRFSQLLFRMVRKYEPLTIIELGTSLGLTTSYLALANPLANVISIEGSQAIAGYARNNFESLGLRNVRLLEGNFDVVLPHLLENNVTPEFVFVDGNHREEPTLRYFNLLVEKMGKNSIIVFDDIHWSAEMEKAWEVIRHHPSVRCTIDLFFIGIVFFRQEFLEKQHFVIRY